jgi:hypothetical protein
MNKLPYLLFLLLLLTGCSTLSTPEIRGIVVDAETGKPIADARIFAEWKLITSGPGGPGAGEVKKEVKLKTGPDGKFVLPPFRLVNNMPYPFGQGGYFDFNIIALGYKGTGYGTGRNGAFESGFAKDITIGKENPIKLIPIRDPKTWVENSGDVYHYIKNDKDYLAQEDRMYVEKFGNGRWDEKNIQMELFYTYVRLKDYRNAKRKAKEIIEDSPKDKNESLYITLKELHIDLRED